MNKRRILYFDLLNICACFGVIALHCNALAHSFANTWEWRQALVVEVICYWAVPIFFMLTGATLIDYRKKYTTRTYIYKRVLRALMPWLFLICCGSFTLRNKFKVKI